MDKSKQIKQVIDQLHYQKLGDVLFKIRNWNSQKDQLLGKEYYQKITDISKNLRKDQQSLESQSSQIISLLDDQKDFISKLKLQTRSNLTKKRSHSCQNQTFLDYTKYFSILWKDRKEKIFGFKKFCENFLQTVQGKQQKMKKNFKKLQNYDKMMKQLKDKFQSKYTKNMDITQAKKNKKYFNITKFKKIQSVFLQQSCALQNILQSLEKTEQFLLDENKNYYEILGNSLITYKEEFEKCFYGNIDIDIQQKMSLKLKQIEGKNYDRDLRKRETKNKIKDVLQKLRRNCGESIQQLKVREWDISVREKQSDSYYLKKGKLTIDSKFYITDIHEKEIIEYVLPEVQISESNQYGEVAMSGKKLREKVQMKFQSSAREDQFFLHLQKLKEQI